MTKAVAFKAKTAATKEVKVPEGLVNIEALTREYAEARSKLAAVATECATKMEAVKTEYLNQLRNLSAEVDEKHEILSWSVAKASGEFEKPRTRVFHGIKVGFQKLVGKLTFADDARTIKLIEKHMPDQFDILVTTSYALNKDAIGTLPADDLKRIGGTVSGADDQVVIKPVAGDIEKLVAALLSSKKGK
jgi:phage host-nuclease inhibitor protein Gam